MVSNKYYALVAGIGTGTGRAVALKFSKEYPVVLLSRRTESFKDVVVYINKNGGKAIGIAADATDEASLAKALQTAEQELLGLQLVAAIYNVRPNSRPSRRPFLDLNIEDLDISLDGNVRGLFYFAQASIPKLLNTVETKPEHSPTFILTGATASIRGSKLWSVIAAGKSGARSLVQSLAREFGEQGVHVGHAIIDGSIDEPEAKYADGNEATPDGKISPYGIAEAYWSLHIQHKSAWTHEIDLRPFNEKF
ncbi:hypothetical protein AC578_6295 [Pseudocercospora eumusae]|uniref:Uncharacterized protein n=1 Tax=Pseudocercospora eumusae TaxID=321146 RepID=A0A139H201_9PEZI|nr:hypothetical protein AC578_6295 [Pseudocercospora eumusae]